MGKVKTWAVLQQLCVCMCVGIYICVCVQIYMCVPIRTCVCARMHVGLGICVCVCVFFLFKANLVRHIFTVTLTTPRPTRRIGDAVRGIDFFLRWPVDTGGLQIGQGWHGGCYHANWPLD